MDKLCLFPGAKLPKKFKHVNFEKFDGNGDRRGHIQAYVSSLSLQDVDEPTMTQTFHETLTGPALQWLLSLDISRRQTWEDMAAAFIKQYEYNVQLKVTTRELESIKMKEKESFAEFVKRWRAKAAQMTDRPSDKDQFIKQYEYNVQLKVTTRELESIKMKEKESFAEFVKRWRAKAAQMTDRPSDKDQMRIITKNLQPDLAQYMVMAQAHNFETYFEMGLSIEEAIRDDILEKDGPIPKTKNNNSGDNTPSSSTKHNSNQSAPINKITVQTNHSKKPQRTLSQFSTPLSLVYKELHKAGFLKPLTPTPLPQKLPAYHNLNAFCAFHQMPGHATDECHRLRHKIQNLIDNGFVSAPLAKLNTSSNQ
ncbi:hypothetical protein Vadar_021227 [Vaccinium darrowii]|uniref:Uncharacterized protein n=1 Tax=Vaccinium darrowii TaxID=229202 RepID=A0ACB7XS77_9ERIC|nr:hypothetical protein Vadar_021227 [Vaccinium darrowii]